MIAVGRENILSSFIDFVWLMASGGIEGSSFQCSLFILQCPIHKNKENQWKSIFWLFAKKPQKTPALLHDFNYQFGGYKICFFYFSRVLNSRV